MSSNFAREVPISWGRARDSLVAKGGVGEGGGGKERGSCQGLDAPLALTCPPVRLSQVLCHRIPVSLADAICDFFSFFLAVLLVLV